MKTFESSFVRNIVHKDTSNCTKIQLSSLAYEHGQKQHTQILETLHDKNRRKNEIKNQTGLTLTKTRDDTIN
jgi:hypothetical protein